MVTFNIIEGEDNTQEIRRILEEEYFPEDKKTNLHDLYRKYHILPKRFSRVAKDMLREQGKPPVLKGRKPRNYRTHPPRHNIFVRHLRYKYTYFYYVKITEGERVQFGGKTIQILQEKAEQHGVKLNEDRVKELKRQYGEDN